MTDVDDRVGRDQSGITVGLKYFLVPVDARGDVRAQVVVADADRCGHRLETMGPERRRADQPVRERVGAFGRKADQKRVRECGRSTGIADAAVAVNLEPLGVLQRAARDEPWIGHPDPEYHAVRFRALDGGQTVRSGCCRAWGRQCSKSREEEPQPRLYATTSGRQFGNGISQWKLSLIHISEP